MTRQTVATDARRGPSRARLARNIRAVYDRATPDEIADGSTWYARARDIAAEISPDDVERGAGVIAALSPRCPWGRNVELARRAFVDGIATGAMGDACRKATRIVAGEHPDDVLRGDKVTTFYANISRPDDGPGVTIDRHAFDIADGRKHGSDDRARSILSNAGVYERFADAYRDVASELNISPAGLQAIVWTVWRREHGINR